MDPHFVPLAVDRDGQASSLTHGEEGWGRSSITKSMDDGSGCKTDAASSGTSVHIAASCRSTVSNMLDQLVVAQAQTSEQVWDYLMQAVRRTPAGVAVNEGGEVPGKPVI